MASVDEKLEDSSTGTSPSRSTEEFEQVNGADGQVQKPRSILQAEPHDGYGYNEGPEESAVGNSPDAEGSVEADPFEVHWDGGDSDPMCPRSLSLARKWTIVLIVSATSFCVTCTSSIYTTTYPQLTEEFNCSRIVATLGLSLFIMGLGLGPMLLAPLSEFYGRRPIYLFSFSFFLVWLIPSAVAKNIETMLISRFLDGLSGSAFLSVAGGTVGDLFNRDQLQLPMLIYTASPFLGPSTGPLIGGFINQYTTWRWTFYVLMIWSGVFLILIVLFVPETYHPVILRNKARKLRKDTGEDRWRAPMEKMSKSIPRTIAYSLLRPAQLLIFEPMCLNLCLFSAILLGILYLFFAAFPLVFEGNHGFSASQTGLSFLGIFVGLFIGCCTDPLVQRNYSRLVREREVATGEIGASEPEYRLPPAIVGSILVPIGLFWFAWTTYASVHWILPIIGSAIFGVGNLLVFGGIFTFLVDAYPLYAASALAANSFARSTFGAVFPLFGVQMYQKLGYQWASSLLAFLTVAMMPFPYIFYRFGARIRSKSRFASAREPESPRARGGEGA